MKLRSSLLPRLSLSQKTSLRLCEKRCIGRRTMIGLSQLVSAGLGNKRREQRFHRQRILPYTQKELYDVVADVDNYHHFVPYCTESKVLTSWLVTPRNPAQDSAETVEKKEARLTVGFMALKESYVSEVTCRPYESVEAVASSGTPLFRKLVTTWRFQPAKRPSPRPVGIGTHADNFQALKIAATPSPDHESSGGPTLLSIDLVFAFANPLYAAASTAFFKDVSSTMIKAFQERCIEVYGSRRK